MATKARRGPRPKASRQAAAASSLTRLALLDAFHSWVVPAVAIPGGLIAYVLYNLELIDRQLSTGLVGVLALVTVLWAGLRAFISERTSRRLAAVLAAYAAVWLAGTAAPFLASLDPGTPLFTTALHPHGSAELPVDGHPGTYRLLVQGTFGPNPSGGNRSVHYRLAVGRGDITERRLEGDFTERFVQQRLGRRGSTTARTLHTEEQYELKDADGHPLRINLSDIAPADAMSSVTVRLYPERFPLRFFLAAGSLVAVGALLIDSWREPEDSEGLLTTLTLGTLLAIGLLAWFGGAHPDIGPVAVYALLGGLGGSAVAMVVTKLTDPLVERFPGRP